MKKLFFKSLYIFSVLISLHLFASAAMANSIYNGVAPTGNSCGLDVCDENPLTAAAVEPAAHEILK